MNSFERWSVRLTSLFIVISGFALLWFQYGVEPTDPFAVVNHPLQIPALNGHVLAAPLFMLAIGFISVRHIWRHIVRGVVPGRRSGLLTALALVPMAVSGYLIQVVVDPAVRSAVVAVHIGSSVLFTAGVAVHLGLMWRYLRKLRHETFCAQVRMKEVLGLESRDVRPTPHEVQAFRELQVQRSRVTDERDPEERDLAETGGPAR